MVFLDTSLDADETGDLFHPAQSKGYFGSLKAIGRWLLCSTCRDLGNLTLSCTMVFAVACYSGSRCNGALRWCGTPSRKKREGFVCDREMGAVHRKVVVFLREGRLRAGHCVHK
jgi:hypothetical protein